MTTATEQRTQVYHKDGGWVGFFMTPEFADEWIKTRVTPKHFTMEIGKPKRENAAPCVDGFQSKEHALAAAEAEAEAKAAKKKGKKS